MSRRLNQVEFNSLDLARRESTPVIWCGRIPSSVRDDLCNPLSALVRPMAIRRNDATSTGPEKSWPRGSPPVSSSTIAGRPRCFVTPRGRAPQAESISFLREYSCS